MYGALKGYAADHWADGRIVIAVAGRQAWLVAPREDINLGEVGPDARLTISEGPGGQVSVRVEPSEP
jgi:Ni,Fe-hydrogenase I large subunit